jgi:glycosyltransferase involved in cell wall biosynthesis
MSTYDDKQAKTNLIERAHQLGVGDNIEFLPFLKEEMLPYYYSMADVVAQPSLCEAASLPIKEAMACGTPVIGSYEDGSREDIGESQAGFLVHNGDVNELAKHLITILKDEKLAAIMGEKGRQRAVAALSWERVVDVIWNVINVERKSNN